MTPVRPREGLHDLEICSSFVGNRLGVWTESKLGVQRDPKDFRVLRERDQGPIEENLRVVAVLMRIRSEERDTGFLRCQGQPFPLCPIGDHTEVVVQP